MSLSLLLLYNVSQRRADACVRAGDTSGVFCQQAPLTRLIIISRTRLVPLRRLSFILSSFILLARSSGLARFRAFSSERNVAVY